MGWNRRPQRENRKGAAVRQTLALDGGIAMPVFEIAARRR